MSKGFKPSFFIFVGILTLSHVALAGSYAVAETIGTSSIPVETEKRSGQWNGKYSFGLGGGDYQEGKDEGVLSYFVVRSQFEYNFAPWMRVKVSPRVDLYASRVQERFEDDDLSSSRLRFTEAYVSLMPSRYVDLRAGAIGQAELNAPLLISSRRAFPGLQQIAKADFKNIQGSLMFQEVVPTSVTLNTERTEKEELPSFLTQSLNLKGQAETWFDWTAKGGHYQWNKLPSKIAFESGSAGNSIAGEVAPGAKFRYGFEGYFWGGNLAFGPREFAQMNFEYEAMKNMVAPSNAGQAQSLGVGPTIHLGDLMDIDVRYRRYFIESDATVAVYSSSHLGNTNRDGDNIDFRIDFKRLKFALIGDWYNARTINASTSQYTMNSYYLGLETNYVSF